MLFMKLQQGVQENEQILTVARMRADAEDLYGNKLGDIEASTNRIAGGFQRDDGASVKKARAMRMSVVWPSSADCHRPMKVSEQKWARPHGITARLPRTSANSS